MSDLFNGKFIRSLDVAAMELGKVAVAIRDAVHGVH